jgi:hypothetical protein
LIELHLRPQPGTAWQHTALATISQGLAAVRDFDPAYLGFGSGLSVIRRCRLQCPDLPESGHGWSLIVVRERQGGGGASDRHTAADGGGIKFSGMPMPGMLPDKRALRREASQDFS